jgi:hypothetical protein
MDGFKAYRYYLAIKLHFTTEKFNVFENRGNVKGTREAFNARNDRYIFEKLATKFDNDRDIIQFFVANFAYGNGNAIYEGKTAEDNLVEWNRRKQSISQIFIDDLAKLLTYIEVNKLPAEAVLNFVNDEYPVALKLFIGGQISIETLNILQEYHPVVDEWSRNSSINHIWGDELLRIKKLTGFVKYNKIKASKVFTHFMEEIAE